MILKVSSQSDGMIHDLSLRCFDDGFSLMLFLVNVMGSLCECEEIKGYVVYHRDIALANWCDGNSLGNKVTLYFFSRSEWNTKSLLRFQSHLPSG